MPFQLQPPPELAFAGPVSVRCHPEGRIFVVDDLAHRILEFDAAGRFHRAFGRKGSGPGALLWPDAIHWDSDGLLYVADAGGGRIQVWDPDGRYLREFGGGAGAAQRGLVASGVIVAAGFGLWLAGAGQLRGYRAAVPLAVCALFGAFTWALSPLLLGERLLRNPRDVWVDTHGRVYASDFTGHAIRVFKKDGELLQTIGARGNGPGQLENPLGLAVSNERLYVVDSRNHRIQTFTRTGEFVSQIGRFGHAAGEFSSPHSIAVANDRLYVSDRGNRRIQVFAPDGRVLETSGPDLGGPRELGLAGLCVLGEDVLVADTNGHLVLRWRPAGP